MPFFNYTAMDSSGQEIKDVVEAENEDEAQHIIRNLGYYPTEISIKKARKKKEKAAATGKKKTFSFGRVGGKQLCMFTRQLSTLQDAGLPILRSLDILENQCTPGALKNALIDIIENIQSGLTLSESMAQCPKAFNRLYVNMVKAGEAGGALETVLRRLAEFQEKSQSLKRKVRGAMVYPIVVLLVAVLILFFIMYKIVPEFKNIFDDFEMELPAVTQWLMWFSNLCVEYWYLLGVVPFGIWLWFKMWRKFEPGRFGFDLFLLQAPIFGQIFQKTVIARTTRTIGTLVASGVPILEVLVIAKETAGNAVFELIYGKVYESVREGESIAQPMRDYGKMKLNLFAMFFWVQIVPVVGALMYLLKANKSVIDAIVVNMIDVGEETGELDKMLYKVADVYDEEVDVLVESLVSLLEPLMIVVLGGIVFVIVLALFLPLIQLISDLSN